MLLLLLCISLLGLLPAPSLVTADIILVHANRTLPTRSAAFGPRVSPDTLPGLLFPMSAFESGSSHPLACAGLPTPQPAPHNATWILLVQRGECAFIDKVRNAQRAGFGAVVVGDTVPDAPLITMYATGDTSDIAIPSVFASTRTFGRLLRAAESGSVRLSQIVLTRDELFLWPLMDLLLLLLISPLLLLLLGYAVYAVHDHQQRTRELLPLDLLVQIPTKKFSASTPETIDGPDDTLRRQMTECVICLDDFRDGDLLRVLPCGHEFHTTCLDPWLTTRKRLCPICKKDACPTETSRLLDTTAGTSASPVTAEEIV